MHYSFETYQWDSVGASMAGIYSNRVTCTFFLSTSNCQLPLILNMPFQSQAQPNAFSSTTTLADNQQKKTNYFSNRVSKSFNFPISYQSVRTFSRNFVRVLENGEDTAPTISCIIKEASHSQPPKKQSSSVFRSIARTFVQRAVIGKFY